MSNVVPLREKRRVSNVLPLQPPASARTLFEKRRQEMNQALFWWLKEKPATEDVREEVEATISALRQLRVTLGGGDQDG